MKRILCMVLVLMMVVTALAACSGGTDTPAATSSDIGESTTSSAAETAADPMADDLPDKDYNGYKFRIAASNANNAEYLHYMYVDDMTGETVNDAIFTANANVRDRFNISMEWVEVNDTHFNTWNHLNNAVVAGDDWCDIAILHDHASVNAMLAGILLNLYDLPNIDTTKPWWPEFTVDALSLNGKLYFDCSAMKYDAFASTRAVFMNREMAEDLKIELPYDMVRKGTWTMDVMKEMSQKAYVDVNGDGKKDEGDRFGWAITGHTYDYMEGFGTDIYKHSSDGKTFILDFYNDYNVKIVSRSCEWFFGGGNDVWFNVSGSNKENAGALLMFANNHSLFSYNSVIRHVRTCANADMTYAILPQPKLDEDQHVYFGGTNDHPAVVPTTDKDHERTGCIIEAMAKEGKLLIQPAFIEISMKSRYSSDPDSAEMLDMIFNNRLVSAGYFYSNLDKMSIAHDVFWSKGDAVPDIASWYESEKGAEQARVDTINEFFAGGKK